MSPAAPIRVRDPPFKKSIKNEKNNYIYIYIYIYTEMAKPLINKVLKDLDDRACTKLSFFSILRGRLFDQTKDHLFINILAKKH